jgi:uncharacterized membrane-anchored protein
MRKLAVIILLLVLVVPAIAEEQAEQVQEGPQIQWTEGPTTVTMGDDLSQIDLGSDYVFAGADDAKSLMEYMGNPPSDQEIGIIFPKDQEKQWFILFEYDPVGYVKDDDKDEINADDILESFRKGTEEANKEREKQGFAPLHITGWYEQPHYDAETNNLTWALLAKGGNGEIINYNTRLLGRRGYTSVVLVATPQELDQYKNDVKGIISSYSYTKGNKYAEYTKGDKIAKYGLAALIAGGAGAAAAKVGLFAMLAKAWKAVLAGAAALFAAVSGFFKRLFRRDK